MNNVFFFFNTNAARFLLYAESQFKYIRHWHMQCLNPIALRTLYEDVVANTFFNCSQQLHGAGSSGGSGSSGNG